MRSGNLKHSSAHRSTINFSLQHGSLPFCSWNFSIVPCAKSTLAPQHMCRILFHLWFLRVTGWLCELCHKNSSTDNARPDLNTQLCFSPGIETQGHKSWESWQSLQLYLYTDIYIYILYTYVYYTGTMTALPVKIPANGDSAMATMIQASVMPYSIEGSLYPRMLHFELGRCR